MLQFIEEKIEKNMITKIKVYNNALWNKRENLYFLEGGSGSCVVKNGKSIVKGISLDEVVKDKKVTFIKMDIEGSELNALKGAESIIKKNKPRLAICIYHKPEDILELPLYILELIPEYRFYIRHYSSHIWETVLYAVTDKEKS